MLTKRNEKMTAMKSGINMIGRTSLVLLSLSTAAIAPNALVSEVNLVDRKVEVSFKRSDLAAAEGVKTVYGQLTKRARGFCRRTLYSVRYLGETTQDCTDDLVSQFVADADMPTLTAYYIEKTGAVPTVQKAQAASLDPAP